LRDLALVVVVVFVGGGHSVIPDESVVADWRHGSSVR
jgi:hypothetical protein